MSKFTENAYECFLGVAVVTVDYGRGISSVIFVFKLENIFKLIFFFNFSFKIKKYFLI